MVPPIDNFISRGTETFLTGPYLDMTMNMYKKVDLLTPFFLVPFY